MYVLNNRPARIQIVRLLVLKTCGLISVRLVTSLRSVYYKISLPFWTIVEASHSRLWEAFTLHSISLGPTSGVHSWLVNSFLIFSERHLLWSSLCSFCYGNFNTWQPWLMYGTDENRQQENVQRHRLLLLSFLWCSVKQIRLITWIPVYYAYLRASFYCRRAIRPPF